LETTLLDVLAPTQLAFVDAIIDDYTHADR